MTPTERSLLLIWESALELETRPEDAIALLVDAAAFGLNEGDFDPTSIIRRLRDTFDLLHITKHIGAKQ
ncbi:hypothetical protein SAMN04489859_102156 [Paracoccus alcaliphilus]|uniref:Uncharacterized protein n=1 Tax=Paracoccus alcaliphilus TaxID=34002 RepID=A0A1H8KBI5_9RHOB|nr:hypothetical protein [Paracoccus alcaliphilus]WCR17079.1 hypothetical protein JHW40_11840 [Paracoccus alcaliphilus]SEN90379.1 hypothetical protein SAMN04489859_102156 [Paracoccus alcaliphilus]